MTSSAHQVVARAAALHWPALLVGSACVGMALAVWLSVPSWVAIAVALVGAGAAVALDGSRRLAALALALAAVGLGWGSLRMDALGRSVLAADLDRSGDVRVVTLAPARTSAFSTRVLAETRSFRDHPVRERVLLKLPVGRSPPRGAILEARVRITEPSPERNGFDERAWLARQGIHVVLRVSDWRQVGRRGGILGLGDRLRERVERAVSRGTSGVRRGVVLGVVLGEDEDLSAGARNDFRASGLYHLLRVEKRVQTRIRSPARGRSHTSDTPILALLWILRRQLPRSPLSVNSPRSQRLALVSIETGSITGSSVAGPSTSTSELSRVPTVTLISRSGHTTPRRSTHRLQELGGSTSQSPRRTAAPGTNATVFASN